MYVYVMREGGILNCAKHKVGIGKAPKRRRRQLQTGNPNGVILIAAIRVRNRRKARRVESRVHDWLSALHINREWFYFPPYPEFLLPMLVRLAKWTTI